MILLQAETSIGTSELLFIIIGILWLTVFPVLAIVFFIQNRQLKKQVESLTSAIINKN